MKKRGIALCCILLFLTVTRIQMKNVPEELSANKTLTLGLLAAWFSGKGWAPAIVPAIETVRQLGILPGYDIEWTWRDTLCNSNLGFRAAVDIWEQMDDVDGYIGATCSSVCQPVALIASAWNLPIVSYSCSSGALSDVDKYPTFFRTVGVEDMIAPVSLAVMETFGWTRAAIVAVSLDLHTSLAKETKRLMEAAGYSVDYYLINSMRFGVEIDAVALEAASEILRTLKDRTRYICVYMGTTDTRLFMVQAYVEGMVNGEYVYLGNEVTTNSLLAMPVVYRPEIEMGVLFEGFIGVNPRSLAGPAWDEFAQLVVDGCSAPQFDGFEDCVTDPDDVHDHAGRLHDAVVLWAHGVNLTLEAGYAPDDGLMVTSHVLNSTFGGGVTGMISLNHVGDRKTDRAVHIIQPGPLHSVPIFEWHDTAQWLEKVYVSGDEDNEWAGLLWGANSRSVPTGIPVCGWDGELCEQPESNLVAPLATGMVFAIIALGGLFSLIIYQYKRRLNQLKMQGVLKCVLQMSDIRADITVGESESIQTRPSIEVENIHIDNSVGQENTNKQHTDGGGIPLGRSVTCTYNDDVVIGKAYGNWPGDMNKILDEIAVMRSLEHRRLNSFVGVAVAPPRVVIVTSYCPKLSLQDLIAGDEIRLTPELKIAFSADIAHGLHYLHKSVLEYHGRLTSANCVIDNYWMCKLTDFGFPSVRGRDEIVANTPARGQLWLAPEILRGNSGCSKQADIYAVGIIIQEIITETGPFETNVPQLGDIQTIESVKVTSDPPYRPFLDSRNCPAKWARLATTCWDEDPSLRPTTKEILSMIVEINGKPLPNLVDVIVSNLEKHTMKLEEIVAERSRQMEEERMKMDYLLQELLPASVSEQLKNGHKVPPEYFEEITLFCSDIVGFTRVCSKITPLQVVVMLNSLYSLFDECIQRHDVYKIATIGDAYMVASGVPVRNGDKHAGEIAIMSLEMLEIIDGFQIQGVKGEQLHMRIGVHTGPCMAAVTGVKTPRYLLFGETVEMTTRIESSGQKMKIHLSPTTAEILIQYAEYDVIPRGNVDIKGSGDVTTFWLLGKTSECV